MDMEEILKRTIQDVSKIVLTQLESVHILNIFLKNLEDCRYN